MQLRAEDGIPVNSPKAVTDTPRVQPCTADGSVTDQVPHRHLEGIIAVLGVPILTV